LIPYRVLGLRSKGGDIDLLTLSGITTKEAADQLSGRSVWLDKAYLEDEEAGDLIDLHHFVGYELYDAQQGTLVGAITALDDTTLNTLLRVEPPSGGELVVPIADELIEHVEVGAHRLYLFIPDGLLEL
jgi:RimM protein, required for 16S rRNA processing